MTPQACFADYISIYTRAQAIEDGALRDVTELAREVGFKLPVAVTAGVWAECVALSEAARRAGCDEQGRLWDVLWIASLSARRAPSGARAFRFAVQVITDRPTPSRVDLQCTCGPGDDHEPVLTILLEGED